MRHEDARNLAGWSDGMSPLDGPECAVNPFVEADCQHDGGGEDGSRHGNLAAKRG